MRWALLMAALMAGGAACAGPEESPRRLTVTGSGSVSVAPEIALLATSVMHQDADVTEAQKRADAAVARYLAAARKLGVADADLQASGASIHPQFEWDKTRRAQELVGYRVTREVSLRIRQLDRLGSFLRAAVDAGMNGMQPAQLMLDDESAVRDEALKRAATDARRQADVLATALGARVGPALGIDVIESGGPMPQMRAMAMADAESAGSSPVATGEIRIERRVQVVFELLD